MIGCSNRIARSRLPTIRRFIDALRSAQSNSKLYARVDETLLRNVWNFEADLEDLTLAGYARKLTGVKVHLENSDSDFVSVTGARPDTAFARDVFPANGLGLLRLSYGEILPGSNGGLKSATGLYLKLSFTRDPESLD